jgi:hypothetical protein
MNAAASVLRAALRGGLTRLFTDSPGTSTEVF